MSSNINSIVSHEFPDLDSILSIYLLKRYGKQKYPGVDNAKLEFYPAGILPEGKSSEELEKEGILVVDTGGGRFDTHPVGSKEDASKADKCASVLVAEDLRLDQRPELEGILTFSRLQDVEGRSLQSTDPIDHVFSLTSIIRGFNLVSEHFESTVGEVSRILDAIIAAEEERCKTSTDGKIRISQCKRLQIAVLKQEDSTKIQLIRWTNNAEKTCPQVMDLDSVLNIYLLRRYGVRKYPELAKARVEFHLADEADEGIEVFKQETFLIVDTDSATNPQGTKANTTDETDKEDRIQQRISGAALITEVLALDTIPELENVVMFVRQIHSKAEAINKTNWLDRTVSLFSILDGFNLLNGLDFYQTFQDVEPILDAIIALEKDWSDAILQYDANSKVFKTGKKRKVTVVAVEAISGSVLKVARWKDKADLTIYRNPLLGHIAITTRQNGPLHNFKLSHLAKLIRTAEAIEHSERVELRKLGHAGDVHGWFLHSSDKILSKGSPKATHIAPTMIPFEALTDLVLSHFDKGFKLPEKYCPPDRCTRERCTFFRLNLPNCHTHRERIIFKSSSLGGRIDLDVLEQLRQLKHAIKREKS